ncbi:putative 5-amp-activated protein kinase [Planoprotostelium fungivorum]|uniref:non-specific serine/threonine protein kinase n=1 Tax=Planoprotostelium fungivorum TaxID=1890364 RepID=A0A2P6NZI0_9EUKA|nr:putative 5-amp-activated protein kinase [Planoprotostelium fungivorum]
MTQTKHAKKDAEKRVGSYIVGETLGEGSFAKVKKGTHEDSGKKVALKFITHDADPQSDTVIRLRREITIQKSLHHPHIARLLEVIEIAQNETCLVVELVEGKDLIDYIQDFPENRVPEREALKLFRQITSAVHHLHENGIVHRDIKLENVMVSHDGSCKLIDFGLASHWSMSQALKTPCGSSVYAAPEILTRRPYRGPKTDVWALGVLLYCIITGRIPWAGNNTTEQLYNTLHGRWSTVECTSKSLSDLICGCLQPDQEARFGIYDVMESEWMKGEARKRVPKRKLSGTILNIEADGHKREFSLNTT